MNTMRIARIGRHLTLFLYVGITLFPLIWLFLSSFKSNREITVDTWALPSQFSFSNYRAAWESAHFDLYVFNSLYVTTIACTLTLALAAMSAFALTQMRFSRLNKWIYPFILIGLLVPPVASFIPLYHLIQQLNIGGIQLYDSHLGLILVYCTYALPISVFILHAFMLSIPRELIEAGVMDGLKAVGIFMKVVLPITLPVLVTVTILNFINNWNEYILSQLFIASDSLRTLPTGMALFNDGYSTNIASLSAAVIMSIIPVLLVYVILQRQIIEGLTAGSVKG